MHTWNMLLNIFDIFCMTFLAEYRIFELTLYLLYLLKNHGDFGICILAYALSLMIIYRVNKKTKINTYGNL